MKVRLVGSLREFDALAPVWRDITKESGQTSPFLSHDWFSCCWRTAGPNRRRELWILERNACPVAFIPLLAWKTRVRGLPVRMLGLLDSPDTPLVDFPVAAEHDAVIDTFLVALRAKLDWDILSLSKLPAHSSTFKALEAALPAHFAWTVARTQGSAYVSISGTWEAFLDARSQEFRRTCGRVEARIRQSGEATIEEHRAVEPDGPVFADIMEVSRLNWNPRGLATATMQGMPRFFRELARRASANGWLHLWMLRLDGRPIATQYQIGADGCIHALRSDFDAALADLSPDLYLDIHIVRSLFERPGIREYNIGRAVNDDHLGWATGIHEDVAIRVYAPTAYGRLLYAIETCLVPLARRLRVVS